MQTRAPEYLAARHPVRWPTPTDRTAEGERAVHRTVVLHEHELGVRVDTVLDPTARHRRLPAARRRAGGRGRGRIAARREENRRRGGEQERPALRHGFHNGTQTALPQFSSFHPMRLIGSRPLPLLQVFQVRLEVPLGSPDLAVLFWLARRKATRSTWSHGKSARLRTWPSALVQLSAQEVGRGLTRAGLRPSSVRSAEDESDRQNAGSGVFWQVGMRDSTQFPSKWRRNPRSHSSRSFVSCCAIMASGAGFDSIDPTPEGWNRASPTPTVMAG